MPIEADEIAEISLKLDAHVEGKIIRHFATSLTSASPIANSPAFADDRFSEVGLQMRDDVVVEAGYSAGLIGRCVEMHASYYARTVGFGRSFEALVAAGLADFAGRLDRPCNEVWCARRKGRAVGTIAIDGEDLGGGIAHLRWFIVDDEARGSGAGRRLLSEALAFCGRHRFAAIHLWTFEGLHAARHLYEAHGFTLAEERWGDQWGSRVLEQLFARLV